MSTEKFAGVFHFAKWQFLKPVCQWNVSLTYCEIEKYHKICVSKNLKFVCFNKTVYFLPLRWERVHSSKTIHWIIFHSIADIIAKQRQHTNTHQTTNGRFTITEFYHNKTVRETAKKKANERRKKNNNFGMNKWWRDVKKRCWFRQVSSRTSTAQKKTKENKNTGKSTTL